jgi:hypothetical protein
MLTTLVHLRRDSEFRQGNLTSYLTAAQELLPLLQASAGHREFTLKPLLLVMSDSPHVSAQMQSGVLMHHDYEVSPESRSGIIPRTKLILTTSALFNYRSPSFPTRSGSLQRHGLA